MPSRLRKRIMIGVPLSPLEGGRANRHTASRDAGKKDMPPKITKEHGEKLGHRNEITKN